METPLSIHIVLDIVLSHLDVEDLLDCRYVSKFWNKVASLVLRTRSSMMKEISKEDQLMELQDCMDQSWDFPFTGLQVDEPWNLSSAGAMAFFINYGARFTYLDLATKCDGSLENFCPFLHHLPRLSLLALDWCRSEPPPELVDPAAGQEAGRTLRLPTLHTLRIYCFLSEDILRAVSVAASPSLRIECHTTSYDIVNGLKSVGKLQAVSVMEVYRDEDEEADALEVDQLLSTQTPALTELDFQDGGCISKNGLIKLLISSQKTLKKLRLDGIFPSEFSQECPVLVKLTTLRLWIVPSNQHLFQEGQGHKFPALKEMEFYMKDDIVIPKVSNGSFIVPSLTKLVLWGYVNKEGIEDLARSFPNVIELRLKHRPEDLYVSREADPFDIWSVGAFKLLEKLKIWDLTVQSPTKVNPIANLKNLKFMSMDTFLTGIPMTICENLRKEPRQNLKDSPFNRILRDNPNLLQLKNLKELIICLKLEDVLEELPEEPPFISMVSVWYALEMMPNLQWKFVYEDSWVKSYTEEKDRDKAVKKLNTAFKLVQPYVELEPFFY